MSVERTNEPSLAQARRTNGPAAWAGRALMAWRRLRLGRKLGKIAPRTLFVRATLAIVVPTILLQVIATYVFYEQLWDNVTGRLARSVVGDVRMIAALHTEFPGDVNSEWIIQRARSDMRMTVTFKPGATLPERRAPAFYSILERELTNALESDLKLPYFLDTAPTERRVLIAVQVPDGVIEVLAPLSRLYTTSSWAFLAAMAGSAMVLFGLATAFVRHELQPIRKLAKTADALGKGRDVADFEPEGSLEARQAGRAFLTMRERLRRQIQQRTEMLAGVSHDLRTPLTRMKLGLAMLDDGPERRELEADVVDMERMIEGYLAFARGEGDEEPTPVDVGELLEDVASGARRDGGIVVVGFTGDLAINLRPTAMKRCLSNLVVNALRHGHRVEMRARRRKTAIEITIDDDGPGIPVDRREEVFRPFFRLDASRNPLTGGVGLGLTIARDVVRSHGGELHLEDSPMGGLRARLRLPV
ncbi:ATP-binding protein [Vineibacter terrae]|uniref:ATP-binding protein n=1 Tax=Vineibacter terrae TaxID=2586908 RepID=UPI002E3757E6|nr:ATP-binding protein [Vineibacter terrae]HEX2889473.1 ATP-binding protein [Vineibacter terrae]